ncbi:hypothetical protein BZA05DRAFT_401694 [Tricharina praecox]|uniref:uncharacterized protein n=1 Tax=Tricharina praecox TaxID=43433 RepID=UPI0022207581|nr:uncharacterized protein BZA05DRAFT_401694 [Tricharina praecox]KAI5849835.1 hypothetical protein BZA05DRAFT_401694 [Tricharina praecox]
MFNRSKRPSSFPKLVFFLLRLVQLICAVSVIGILAYFLYHLWQDGYTTPYEFSLLDFASAATLLNLLITSVLLCCCGLSPLYVLIFDTLLFIVWAVSFGLLVRSMGSTTTQSCSTANWGNADGIRVCHMFKTLVAMSFIATLSCLAMVVVAVVARRKQAMHKYEPAHNPTNIRTADTAYSGGGGGSMPAHGQLYGAHPVPPAYTPAPHHDGKPEQQYSAQHGATYYN